MEQKVFGNANSLAISTQFISFPSSRMLDVICDVRQYDNRKCSKCENLYQFVVICENKNFKCNTITNIKTI